MSYRQNLAVQNAGFHDTFRLVRVLNRYDERSQRMRCEVRLFSLRQAPRYIALSYCWRNKDDTQPVDFQGTVRGTRQIANDLHAALCAMLKWHKDGWLWVDAICIDQTDFREKNDQVPRMQSIFRLAQQVDIWLGAELPDEPGDENFGPPTYKRDAALGLTRAKLIQLGNQADEGRAWWSRVWVIQEMVLAAQLFVCIGSKRMPWKKFRSSTSHWEWYDHRLEFVLWDARARICMLDRLRKDWQLQKHCYDMLELLDLGRQSHATEGRDNIYALLPLMRPEDRRDILVDYNCSCALVYSRMTRLLISREQNFNFLVRCFTNKSTQSPSTLPSWVLDFSDGHKEIGDLRNTEYLTIPRAWKDFYLPRDELPEFKRPIHRASASSLPVISSDHASLKLRLQVVLFDDVSTSSSRGLGPRMNDEIDYAAKQNAAESWLRSVIALLDTSSQQEISSAGPRFSISRTKHTASILLHAVDDFDTDWSLWWDDLLSMLEALDKLGTLHELSEPQDERSRFKSQRAWETVYEMSLSYTIFTTVHGFAGIARFDKRAIIWMGTEEESHSACRDDTIVIALGSSKPWVLRKTDTAGEYTLLIDCIIPDIMSGEVIDLAEDGLSQAEWITIV